MKKDKTLTAVEWLVNKIIEENGLISSKDVKQAKELEKQQIIDANNDGYKVGRKTKKFETAEQYYTQTYEK